MAQPTRLSSDLQNAGRLTRELDKPTIRINLRCNVLKMSDF